MYYDVKESGMRIKELRIKAGMTQEELSEKLDITKNAYQKIERGANGAKIDTLIELANIFNETLDFIVGGVQTKTVESMIDRLDEKQQKFILKSVENMIRNFKEMF